ncbi:MAG TPA: transglutaminase-like domain-containing protein [Pirellulaceae bacterium]|nr:transglutaminase-like domain-containing protein [Pirellulaceae bacterium]
MLSRVCVAAILVVFAGVLHAEERGIRLGEATTSTWRIGVTVRAPGAVTGILATTPVPMDWPEQQVKIVSEEKTDNVAKLSYRTLDDGVKQMLVSIPRLNAGEEASAIVTFEVTRREILAPDDTSVYQTPAKSSRELSKFLLPSPYIESTDAKIRMLATDITAGKEPSWERAAAAFDWVRANVKYEFAEQIKPAVQALQDGQGDCEELSSLVIALCRASKIPARAVWVPGHCYPEFYLVDDKGEGHWFPCQAAGADRQFGSMIEDRPILQKGDNFRVPEERGPQRYVKQFLSAKNAAANPEVKFVLEKVE